MRSLLIRPIQAGFTLVELLIVVIILAVLAAIIVPQFSGATKDAQDSALDANLSTIRSAIELYRVQHNNRYPAADAVAIVTACTGAVPAAKDAATFKLQLTSFSDQNGVTCPTGDPTNYRFGPYLRKIPVDPIKQSDAILPFVTVAPGTITPGTAGGWAYSTVTGQFQMNDVAGTLDSKGQPYSTH